MRSMILFRGNIEDALSKLQVNIHFMTVPTFYQLEWYKSISEWQMMFQWVDLFHNIQVYYELLINLPVSQDIIDAASYVPPPPSEEQVKRITKL